MSFDAGGLAQMTYNNANSIHSGNGLGLPGSGFASRGKGAHIKRLSVAPPTINEDGVDDNPAPRTSRSHLLAGLRTAPKTPGAPPASAPYTQTQHRFGGLDASRYAANGNVRGSQGMPQTAATPNFPRGAHGMPYAGAKHAYGMSGQAPEILAPPALGFDDNEIDPQIYDQLMAQNMYLMQRQQQLQEQLRQINTASQQLQGINLNGGKQQQQQQQQQQQYQQFQQYPQTPNTPSMGFYNQQLQNGMQPQVQAVPGQPGLYVVYNPLTQQSSYVLDPAFQQGHLPASPPTSMPGYDNRSPDSDSRQGYFKRDTMSPNSVQAAGRTRTFTPPKQTPSPPANVEPLPEPSANAFRPGHRKSMSIALSKDGSRTVAPGPKTAGFAVTPMTGTFGPGMGRAGEHPVRQPRGPPNLEELIAAPTSKHEGSKNFATRQRRRAVLNLVRAGNERRTGRSGSRDAAASGSDGDALSSASSDGGVDGAVSAAPRSWRSSMLG